MNPFINLNIEVNSVYNYNLSNIFRYQTIYDINFNKVLLKKIITTDFNLYDFTPNVWTWH
jgi:hypothetical protein